MKCNYLFYLHINSYKFINAVIWYKRFHTNYKCIYWFIYRHVILISTINSPMSFQLSCSLFMTLKYNYIQIVYVSLQLKVSLLTLNLKFDFLSIKEVVTITVRDSFWLWCASKNDGSIFVQHFRCVQNSNANTFTSSMTMWQMLWPKRISRLWRKVYEICG